MRNRNKLRAKRERRAARKRVKRKPVRINGKQYDYESITIVIDGEPYGWVRR